MSIAYREKPSGLHAQAYSSACPCNTESRFCVQIPAPSPKDRDHVGPVPVKNTDFNTEIENSLRDNWEYAAVVEYMLTKDLWHIIHECHAHFWFDGG